MIRQGYIVRAQLAKSACFSIVLAVFCGCSSQTLEPWHKTRLDEFTASMSGDEVQSLGDYLALEDRLFDDLEKTVYADVGTGPEYTLVRYSAGSAADPFGRTPDYNRTFELSVDGEAAGAVLLLHGMSDSPYSLRSLGVALHRAGYHVIGLRLPGHGTAPAELKHATWRDMAAAVRLAMDHLVEIVDERPVHIIGYSTGAALALDYALDALDDPVRQNPASLVLVSPAIGISAAAALARPIAALGRIPGLSRLGWTAIVPEFDPYKYNSFTTNAGSQVRQLTQSVASRIGRLNERADALPPILAFKSTVDATVTTEAIADRLLRRLPDNGNELMLFDINRSATASPILIEDPGPLTDQLMNDPSLPFAVRLVTNEDTKSLSVVAHLKPAYANDVTETETLGLTWPRGILSLSHVALPFAPDDPLYGQYPPESGDELFLGQLDILGERGLLRISSDWLLRLRYNPFYPVLESRTLAWVATHADAG
jgi:alpha-beta hydrolase superfamily lysophospholipase